MYRRNVTWNGQPRHATLEFCSPDANPGRSLFFFKYDASFAFTARSRSLAPSFFDGRSSRASARFCVSCTKEKDMRNLSRIPLDLREDATPGFSNVERRKCGEGFPRDTRSRSGNLRRCEPPLFNVSFEPSLLFDLQIRRKRRLEPSAKSAG